MVTSSDVEVVEPSLVTFAYINLNDYWSERIFNIRVKLKSFISIGICQYRIRYRIKPSH